MDPPNSKLLTTFDFSVPLLPSNRSFSPVNFHTNTQVLVSNCSRARDGYDGEGWPVGLGVMEDEVTEEEFWAIEEGRALTRGGNPTRDERAQLSLATEISFPLPTYPPPTHHAQGTHPEERKEKDKGHDGGRDPARFSTYPSRFLCSPRGTCVGFGRSTRSTDRQSFRRRGRLGHAC